MDQDFYFSTVRFGGFDKKEVLERLKDLVEDYEEQIEELKQEKEQMQQRLLEVEAKALQMEQSALTLRDKNTRLMEYNELLNAKCTEKGMQLKAAQDRAIEIEKAAIAAGNTTSKMLSDTQAQCKQMIQEARSTSQAIISSAIKERTLKVNELDNEYRSKRRLLISLSEDYEAFQHHIQKTYSALKDIVDHLPEELKEESLYHE